MYNKSSFAVINFIFRFTVFFKSVPFSWHSTTLRLSLIRNFDFPLKIKLKLNWSVLSSCCLLLHCAFELVRTISKYFFVNGKKDGQSKATPQDFARVINIVRYFLLGTICLNTMVKRHEIQNLVNHIFEVQANLQKYIKSKQYLDSSSRGRPKPEKLLTIFVCVSFAQIILTVIGVLKNPNASILYYSLVKYVPVSLAKVPLGIIVSMDTLIYWNFAMFVLAVLCLYGYSGKSALRDLVRIRRKLDESGEDQVDHKELMLYRQLQVLSVEFNKCFSGVLLPVLQSTLLIISIIPLFMTIRFFDSFPPLYFVMFPLRAFSSLTIINSLFSLFADLNHGSVTFIAVATMNARRIATSGTGLGPGSIFDTPKERVKYWTGCKPLRAQFGTFYFMRKFTVFRLLSFILYYTMRMLLIF